MNPRKLIAAVFSLAAVGVVAALGFVWGVYRTADADKVVQVRGDSMWPTLADGDFCRITPRDRLIIGDVVAIDTAGTRQIKRVAAVAGDQVSFRQGRLLVNGRRLEDQIALRKDDFLRPDFVSVRRDGFGWEIVDDTKWIIYRHQNAHAGNRATAIMDDYPINESVRRTLHPVDRLAVRIGIPSRSKRPSVLVRFFVEGEIREVITDEEVVRSRDAETVEASDVPSLDDSHPIAIQLTDSTELRMDVLREVEYRVYRPNDSVEYPLTVADGQVFVVGDNGPVSVDSRTVGTIAVDAVLGVVSRSD